MWFLFILIAHPAALLPVQLKAQDAINKGSGKKGPRWILHFHKTANDNYSIHVLCHWESMSTEIALDFSL